MPDLAIPVIARTCNLCDSRAFGLQYEKSGYSILRCTNCGLIFADPIPDDETLKSIYGREYFQGQMYRSYQDEIDQRTPDFLKWIQWIEDKSGLEGGRWLDIGCATGGFMRVAARRGWSVCGVDYSDYCVGEARAADLEAEFGTARAVPDLWGDFNVISMWDTIEHLSDPASDVTAAARRLKPDGCMVISTGDIASLAARLMGKHWWLMIPPVHLYFFTRSTLTKILNLAGLTPLAFRHFGRRLRIGRAFRLLTGIGSVSMEGGPSPYFNAFDIITVIARHSSPERGPS